MTARATWKAAERRVAADLQGQRIPVTRRYVTQRVWDQLPADYIIARFTGGVSAESLAKDFGVGPCLIRRVLRRHGVLTNPSRAAKPEDLYIPEPNSGCWLWAGQIDRKGYGIVWVSERATNMKAHRVIYERHVGPIAVGLQLDHTCRNRACVNPDHLEPVTNAVNQQRGAKAKLSAASVAEMRSRYSAGGVSQERLGVEYGIHVETVRSVLHRKTWANVK